MLPIFARPLAAAALGVLALGCSSSTTAPGGSPTGSADGTVPGGSSSVAAELVGSWYAGAGGTTAPYSPSTGQWGTPTGKGLVYVFSADASYTKAFQSYVSNGGCTNGFTAFESGTASTQGDRLFLTPARGNMKVSDSCAPSLNSDEPLKELTNERFTWAVGPAEDGEGKALRLTADDGASSLFRPL